MIYKESKVAPKEIVEEIYHDTFKIVYMQVNNRKT